MTSSGQPLAARIRPQTLADYFGQQHLLAEDSPLRRAIESGELHSMIFWGPPGTGKTTLAQLLIQKAEAECITLSAVTSGVKDIRQIVDRCRQSQASGHSHVVFIDEIHRFNKSQQDALLPHVENGLFTLIGATTENPSFEINNALLSRVRVYSLKKLSERELEAVLARAVESPDSGFPSEIGISQSAAQQIAAAASGDARAALTMLELAMSFAQQKSEKSIDEKLLAEVLQKKGPLFDKRGEHFYDLISALHKAVRGSDADAALYWLARMLEGGCDPLYVSRRVVRMASEDIGNADPRALRIALDAWDALARLGEPEGELALAQAVVYMAVAPKSNAVYKAFGQARQLAKRHPGEDVPLHLRNAPTALMKELGYGREYRYAHDYPEHYAAGEAYLPEELHGVSMYQPSENGLERRIRERMQMLKSLDAESDFSRYEEGEREC